MKYKSIKDLNLAFGPSLLAKKVVTNKKKKSKKN